MGTIFCQALNSEYEEFLDLFSVCAGTDYCATMAQKGKTKLTISDKIETDTEFYFRKLSIFPSKMATIIGNQCADYNNCVVYLDIYTTEDDQNFRSNCSGNVFGQLRVFTSTTGAWFIQC